MPDITYGSVCSGIEAATQAWHPMGMRAAWFAGSASAFCNRSDCRIDERMSPPSSGKAHLPAFFFSLYAACCSNTEESRLPA